MIADRMCFMRTNQIKKDILLQLELFVVAENIYRLIKNNEKKSSIIVLRFIIDGTSSNRHSSFCSIGIFAYVALILKSRFLHFFIKLLGLANLFFC
jgi:hypothetical protein